MPPVLLSQRLRLRPPREEDLDNIFRLGSNPEVMRYITPGRTQSLSEARVDLERRMSTVADDLGYWIAELRPTGEFLGWMALRPMDDKTDIEIGYRFLSEHWGRGYATEGAARVLEYAFCTLGIERVMAVAIEANRASTRVMEKLGMAFTGRGRYYGAECVRYEIIRENFLLVRP